MPLFAPGATCGTYVIARHLGAGEVADVYEAIARGGGRRALKILREQLPLGSPIQARIAQEAESLAMIEHVNVVRFHEAGIHEGRVWLALELVDGRDLRRVVQEAGGRLPVERAVAWIRQAAEGLSAAHRQGILHRDIKPENILVTRDDLVKVADFGSAKLPRWGVETTPEERVGSALYMAPELWTSRATTLASDVYAMGVVLYEVLAGEHPLVKGPATMIAICERHLRHEARPLHEVRPDVPTDVSLLVQRAMDKDPERRGSMRELAEGLESALQRLLVWRRAAARNIALPNRDPALAKTELAMPVWEEPTLVGSHASEAASAPMGDAVSQPAERAERVALPPPVASSPPVPWSSPAATLRVPVLPVQAPALPPPSLPAASEAGWLPASSPLVERRSTGAPVESAAVRPAKRSRAARVVAVVIAVVGVGAGLAWTVFGGGGEPPRPAAPPAPPVSASAPVGTATSGAAASGKGVAPKAPVRRPARRKTGRPLR